MNFLIISNMEYTRDNLLKKKYEPASLYMIFANKVDEYGENKLYCFVEDYDMSYYSSPVRNNSELDWISIRCHGKKNVIGIFNYIKDMPRYSIYAKRFFVDADFDDNSTLSKEIYVTSGYSIENFYVDEDCMKKILETEYEIDPVEDRVLFERTMSLFTLRLSQFHQAVVLFNAWYACLYSDCRWNRQSVSLGATFPTDLLKYKIQEDIKATYTLADIQKKYQDAPIIDERLVEEKKKELLDNPQKMRGKYELEFLIKFIKFLNQDAGTRKFQYTKIIKNFSFGDNVALASLSTYSSVPKDLKNYIRTGIRTANF